MVMFLQLRHISELTELIVRLLKTDHISVVFYTDSPVFQGN